MVSVATSVVISSSSSPSVVSGISSSSWSSVSSRTTSSSGITWSWLTSVSSWWHLSFSQWFKKLWISFLHFPSLLYIIGLALLSPLLPVSHFLFQLLLQLLALQHLNFMLVTPSFILLGIFHYSVKKFHCFDKWFTCVHHPVVFFGNSFSMSHEISQISTDDILMVVVALWNDNFMVQGKVHWSVATSLLEYWV